MHVILEVESLNCVEYGTEAPASPTCDVQRRSRGGDAGVSPQQSNQVFARLEGTHGEDIRLWQAAGQTEGFDFRGCHEPIALLGCRVRDVHALLGHAQEAHDITSRMFRDGENVYGATNGRPRRGGQVDTVGSFEGVREPQEAQVVDGDHTRPGPAYGQCVRRAVQEIRL